jgi:hypothetical protein
LEKKQRFEQKQAKKKEKKRGHWMDRGSISLPLSSALSLKILSVLKENEV